MYGHMFQVFRNLKSSLSFQSVWPQEKKIIKINQAHGVFLFLFFLAIITTTCLPACLGASRLKPCFLRINWTVKWVSFNTNIQPTRKDLNGWIALMHTRIWHGFLGLANQEKMAVVSTLLLSRFSGCVISKSQVLLFF